MNSAMIVLADSNDEEAIIPLMEAFNEAEGITWQLDRTAAALRRLLRDGHLGLILLARAGLSGVVIGYVLATFGFDLEFGGRDAFITELYVETRFRGRGIGRALLDAMTDQLQMRGALAVHLMVHPANERAKALYESCGFEVVPRIMMTKHLESADGKHGA